MTITLDQTSVPPRALVLSVAALAVPVSGSYFFRGVASDYELLLWLLALVPAFLLAYYRGWRGVATALAGGMALLSTSQALLAYFGASTTNWPLLLLVVAVFFGVSVGIGLLTEMLHRARREVERYALVDEVTQIPNRRAANLFLAKEFAAAQRGRPVVVAIFDIDHFKRYNDRYGHAVGDQVLRAFGGVLQQYTRRMNLSARLGGEEFVTILSDATVEGAMVFVERVRDGIRDLPEPGGPVTASAGVAAFRPEMRTAEDLLEAADRALYRAKAEGRDRACVADAELVPG